MIWVIGGTKDSRDFIESFPFKEKLIVTTATEYGGKLLEEVPKIKVLCKRMSLEEIEEFIKENKILEIVDLTHPYAVEISQNAMDSAIKYNIRYTRFERETLEDDYGSIQFNDIFKLVNYLEDLSGNILVTLGSNNLDKFKNLKNLSNIYFRILPKWDMVKKAEDNGILPKQIIAMQGPFSKELNIAMMNQLNIKYLVSKKGGNTGGEKEKIDATKEVGAVSLLLSKPEIDYPIVFSKIDELIIYLLD